MQIMYGYNYVYDVTVSKLCNHLCICIVIDINHDDCCYAKLMLQASMQIQMQMLP